MIGRVQDIHNNEPEPPRYLVVKPKQILLKKKPTVNEAIAKETQRTILKNALQEFKFLMKKEGFENKEIDDHLTSAGFGKP